MGNSFKALHPKRLLYSLATINEHLIAYVRSFIRKIMEQKQIRIYCQKEKTFIHILLNNAKKRQFFIKCYYNLIKHE